MVLQRQGFLKAEARCGRASLKRHWTASGGVVRSAHGSGRALVLCWAARQKTRARGSDCDVCEVAQLVLLFGSFRCCAR